MTTTLIASFAFFYKLSINPAITDVGNGCLHYRETCQRFFFMSEDGIHLSILWVQPEQFKKYALFVTGYGLNSTDETATFRAKALLREGYAVAILDHRNHGFSERSPTTAGKLEQLDVLAALAFSHGLTEADPSLIWCGSMGCNSSVYGVLEYQRRHPDYEVDLYIIEGPMEKAYESIRKYIWEKHSIPWIPIGWLATKLSELYSGASPKDLYLARDIVKLRQRQCYVLHGEKDEYFSKENAELVAHQADPPCRFILVPDAQHDEIFEKLGITLDFPLLGQ